MQGKHVYEYSVIRLVPRVEREEFINIGVLLYCKHEDYLKIKFLLKEEKILAIYSNVDLELVQNYIAEIKKAVDNDCDTEFLKALDVPSKFRWLSAKKSTMIQYSPIHVGMSDDLDKALEDLMKMMVV